MDRFNAPGGGAATGLASGVAPFWRIGLMRSCVMSGAPGRRGLRALSLSRALQRCGLTPRVP
eukprot:1840463-Prymnesium_polylepis.1